ncbi:FtsX-like permease family protein [Streptomyces hesseae]|uniref:FtsX-like permease family protein n=1 Tax=Streptomyces hesseae TaxID=3075519 RepID=A0ABU2SF24_9ACTN|nr:FtsX-like permease family protein [Streptomyces sp. DSM 40473]MDT0447581.1 FtsX-like permease family protein [Streptomyces sp. DSM 40473]
MMNGLARASVRFRPASFVGGFVALLLGATVLTACGLLLQTGITAEVEPVRYAHAPVVVAGDPFVRTQHVKHGKEKEEESVALPERGRVDSALVGRIAARPGVAAAVPDLSFPVQPGGGALPSVLTGRAIAAVGLTAPGASSLVAGRGPGAGEVVLDEATARAARLSVGDRVALTAPGGGGSYRVSGLAAARAGGASVWFADAVAGRMSGHPGTVDAIAVRPRAGVTGTALAEQVRRAVDGRAEVLTGAARGGAEEPGLAEGRTVLTALGGSFGGIAAMTAVFVVMGTIALATAQRAREFALLRAIGATPRQIRRTIAAEAMLVAPVAGALGILPGLALARWWFGELVARGAVPGQVSLDTGPLPMVIAVGTSVLAALIAGYAAARRPARLRPGQALGEAALERARPGVVRIVLGALSTTGAVVLAFVSARLDGADAANTALGVVMCFLLAVALLGPLLARLCTGLLGLPLRAGAAGAAGSLAADNARAQARRLASAITPIVMVTAFCGTLVFLQSTIRHVSAQQVERAVVADHVLAATGPGLPATAADAASRVPGVASATGLLRTGVVVRPGDGLSSVTALGVSGDPATLPKVLDLGVTSGSLRGLGAATDTVALDASLADTLGVRTGDRVPLRLGDGTAVRPTVVATYERGLGMGQVLLPRAVVAPHVTAALDSHVLVADAPDADRAEVARRLAGLATGATVTDAAGYSAQADRNQELNGWANTVMAAVLGGFAAVAAANTLVMTVLDRHREVALLRLSGTTRRQVRGMMRWEALLVAGTGLLVGGAIAWITLVPVARGVTGAAPHVPAGLALSLAAGAVVLTLAATGLPTRALLRTRPLEAGVGRQ